MSDAVAAKVDVDLQCVDEQTARSGTGKAFSEIRKLCSLSLDLFSLLLAAA